MTVKKKAKKKLMSRWTRTRTRVKFIVLSAVGI